jgi:hypothetical protein
MVSWLARFGATVGPLATLEAPEIPAATAGVARVVGPPGKGDFFEGAVFLGEDFLAVGGVTMISGSGC